MQSANTPPDADTKLQDAKIMQSDSSFANCTQKREKEMNLQGFAVTNRGGSRAALLLFFFFGRLDLESSRGHLFVFFLLLLPPQPNLELVLGSSPSREFDFPYKHAVHTHSKKMYSWTISQFLLVLCFTKCKQQFFTVFPLLSKRNKMLFGFATIIP